MRFDTASIRTALIPLAASQITFWQCTLSLLSQASPSRHTQTTPGTEATNQNQNPSQPETGQSSKNPDLAETADTNAKAIIPPAIADETGASVAMFEMVYGLDHDGEPITFEKWTNLIDDDEPVPMITRAGLLAMAQNALASEEFEDDDGDWGDDETIMY